jgi:hypothetical protein
VGALNGHHVLNPSAPNFRPRRDVDLFLDRKYERVGKGFLHAVAGLGGIIEADRALHGDMGHH